jgi:hypothetical protein
MVMGSVEKPNRTFFEHTHQHQSSDETSNMGEPSYATTLLPPAQSPLKNLNNEVKPEYDSSRNVHHPYEDSQKNENKYLCPRIKQDICTQNP